MPDSLAAISLTVDGETVTVAPGTTVAAAVAGARHALRTSVSGEPRGPLCGMGICFECRVTIDGIAHRRSCLILCEPGLTVSTAAPGEGEPRTP